MRDVSQKTSSESSSLPSPSSSFYFSLLRASSSQEAWPCPRSRTLGDAHGAGTVSLLQTGTAWCFSKEHTSDRTTTPPPFTRAPITLGPSSRSLAQHTRSLLISSILCFYHIPKWLTTRMAYLQFSELPTLFPASTLPLPAPPLPPPPVEL